jgi:transcription initiation factor IIE alpha subunit
MSTRPTGSPESKAQQPYYLCPRCDVRWSLRDIRYCYACRDCGGGLIILKEESTVIQNGLHP